MRCADPGGTVTINIRLRGAISSDEEPRLAAGAEVWSIHLIAASDWADFAEMHSDHINAQRDLLWLNEPEVVDGYITPTDHPGFGVTLNEAML